MSTDFFDNDLLNTNAQKRDEAEDKDGVPVRPITEAGLSRMARQKKELASQVAGAVKEIESLRMRQEALGKEKSDMEELARRQEEYQREKRDLVEKLSRGIMWAEKEEIQATRMGELLAETRGRFKQKLSELRSIDEGAWLDGNFQAELSNALAVVEDARMVYEKALAKIEAASWHRDAQRTKREGMFEEAEREFGRVGGFSLWLKIGLAVSLPLIAAMLIFFIALLLATGIWPG